jgi:hypothetical protein
VGSQQLVAACVAIMWAWPTMIHAGPQGGTSVGWSLRPQDMRLLLGVVGVSLVGFCLFFHASDVCVCERSFRLNVWRTQREATSKGTTALHL